MKFYKYIIVIQFLLISTTLLAQKKAVMVLLDGIPPDVLERVETPTMDEISKAGGYTRAFVGGMKDGYSETPTISAPGYMNMITGTWAHKHNVRDNAVDKPNYHYWNIFRIVETVKPSLSTAIFSTWEDNRTKLIGEGLVSAGNIKLDYSFDGFELDTMTFPHRADRKFIFDIDEHVSKEAGNYIQSKAPDLSWVYLEFPDDMGHKFGDSEKMDDAVRKADLQVKRIWDAIKKREAAYGEDWMIVITTDHGRTPSDGKGHGGQSERERATWIITNKANLNASFNKNPGIIDIMPSVLTHLEIEAPAEVKAEIDGISFLGDIAVDDVKAIRNGNKIEISWTPLQQKGDLEVYLSSSNNYSRGGEDHFKLLGKENVGKGNFTTELEEKAAFYKILIKSKYNWATAWLPAIPN